VSFSLFYIFKVLIVFLLISSFVFSIFFSKKYYQNYFINKYNEQKEIMDKELEQAIIDLNIEKNILQIDKKNLLTCKVDFKSMQEDLFSATKVLKYVWEEYITTKEKISVEHLSNKKYPSLKSAEEVKKWSQKYKNLKNQSVNDTLLIKYVKNLFPETSIIFDSTDIFLPLDIENHNVDLVTFYISNSEYKKLSDSDKNQIALDNYIQQIKNNKLSPLAKGLIYEMYIGYCYEQMGFIVEYNGVKQGKSDLICKKDSMTHIVQCKFWSNNWSNDDEKIIFERHINQLYGTTFAYFLDKNQSSL
jgi:hypothetical protein